MPLVSEEEYEEIKSEGDQFKELDDAEDALFKEDDEHVLLVKTFDTDKYDMYDLGIGAGLSESAAGYLKHFEYVEVEMKVNKETGRVVAARVIS